MTETIEIFELAAQNSDYLHGQFQSLKKDKNEIEDNLLDDFCKKLQEEWNISANMSDWALVDWLDSGSFKNIYEVKKLQADELIETKLIDPADKDSEVEAAIIAHLDQFYERRTIFDSTFRDGKKLKYLALNIGGLGIDKYGPYCTVVDREKVKKYNTLAFIKMDSAVKYIKNGRIEMEQLKRDLAVEECMPLLATIKHESHLGAEEPCKWNLMLCSNGDYIEAVTLNNIKDDHIMSVRVNKSFYDTIYKDLLMKHFKGEEVNPYELYRMNLFKHIITELKNRHISLEIIDEN